MSCTDSREYLDKKYLLPVTFDFIYRFLKQANKRGYILYTVYREDTVMSNKILNPQLLLRAIKWDGKWNATMLNN